MNTSTELSTLSSDTLSLITAGNGPTIPPPGPVNHNDFSGKYVQTLKNDVSDWWAREGATADALNKKDYGNAALNFGAAVGDGLGTVIDAIAPYKALT